MNQRALLDPSHVLRDMTHSQFSFAPHSAHPAHPIYIPGLAAHAYSGPQWRIAQDAENPLLEKLQMAVEKLLEAMDSALNGDGAGAQASINRVGMLLNMDGATHAPTNPATTPASGTAPAIAAQPDIGTVPKSPALVRGGLAPWQVRHITTHIDTQLGSSITTEDLAKIARLSPCHFSRAFRESFGDSPHKYVMRRRVERAQGLMLSSGMSLGQIAVECGLADQAHLCKLFLKIVGESPGMWRRARSSQPI